MRSSIGTYSTVCTARLTSVKALLDALIKEAVMVYLPKRKFRWWWYWFCIRDRV